MPSKLAAACLLPLVRSTQRARCNFELFEEFVHRRIGRWFRHFVHDQLAKLLNRVILY
jgi:hypothetical protein